MTDAESVRFVRTADDGRHVFLIDLLGHEKGLEVTTGWAKDIQIPSHGDPAQLAAHFAATVGLEVGRAMKEYLPVSVESAAKGTVTSQAARIGTLIARWYYPKYEAMFREAYSRQAPRDGSDFLWSSE